MSARTLRLSLRALHLFAALGIFGYTYGTVTQQMAQFLFVPMLTLSGLIMWQLPRIRRVLRRLDGVIRRIPAGRGAPDRRP